MTAVHLYDQPLFKAQEVHYVWSKRLLSPKFQAL